MIQDLHEKFAPYQLIQEALIVNCAIHDASNANGSEPQVNR